MSVRSSVADEAELANRPPAEPPPVAAVNE
jgi:hypothetical protein